MLVRASRVCVSLLMLSEVVAAALSTNSLGKREITILSSLNVYTHCWEILSTT